MSDHQPSTRRTAERGAEESDGPRGFTRPRIDQKVRRRPRHRAVPVNVRRLAVAVLCACLLTVPVLPASGTSDFVPAEPDSRPAVENRTTPGGALSETLVTHEARVAGSLQASVVEVDLTTSPSDRARAHRLAAFEGTLAEQLGWLQDRVRAHADDNESDVQRPADADIVRTRARALALRGLAERANQTVASLPENSARSAGVDDGDFEAVARSSQAIAENGSDRPDDRDGERDDERVDERDDDPYDRHSPSLVDPDPDGFAHERDGGAPWHDDARADDEWPDDGRTNWSDAPSADGGWPWIDSWQRGLWNEDGGDSDEDGWNWPNHDEDGWDLTSHDEDAASEDDADTDVADTADYRWNDSFPDGGDRTHFGAESETSESGPWHDVEDGFPTRDGWSDDGDAAKFSSALTEPWTGAERDDGPSPYFDADDVDGEDGGDGGDGAVDEGPTDDGGADERWFHGDGDHDGPSYDGAHSYGGQTADDGDWTDVWGAGD